MCAHATFVKYERLPKFYSICGFIGLDSEHYKRNSTDSMRSMHVRPATVRFNQEKIVSLKANNKENTENKEVN